MKLRTGQENSVKKAIFWQFRSSPDTQLKHFDCVQMNLKVEFLDTSYEKIRKSEVPKMVIFGRKPKPLAHLHFTINFKNFNESETYKACALPLLTTREKTFKI